MRSYLNLPTMLMIYCIVSDRMPPFHAENSTEPILDNPEVVVGVFLLETDNSTFLAVGISISEDAVVTVCVPLVKTFRGREIEMYDASMYGVKASVDMNNQVRLAKSVHCFNAGGRKEVLGASTAGEGGFGVLKLEKPVETRATIFVTEPNLVEWVIGMRCKLYFYRKDTSFEYELQSIEVMPMESQNSCTEFTKAETGAVPGPNQLCSFPQFPDPEPCDAILPGSPVFCSGSQLIGLMENHSLSILTGRCFFLVDAFSTNSTDVRVISDGEGSAGSNSRHWLACSLLVMTFL